MNSSNGETVFFVGRCKCCLNEGELKNLWTPEIFEGEIEIYGQMLSECFALSFQQPEEHLQYMEMICNSCILRLRDALAFKREVLVSDEVLREHQEELMVYTAIKVEQVTEDEMELEKDFEEVEYLEINEVPIKEEIVSDHLVNDASQSSEEQFSEKPKKKWPKKLPKRDRNKTYKQYTVKQLKMAIDAVVSNNMSRKHASEMFGVPRKTLSAKLQSSIINKEEIDDEATKLYEQEKHYKLVEEIKTILTYTNAIPYKTKTSRYYCAYCSTDGMHFEDPDDLRTHTRTVHAEERTSSIDQIMKPQWLNEVLKMDIHSLHCTVCCTILLTWNDMFRHLENEHKVYLDEAYNRVIPYTLTRQLSCALCGDSFPNYHNLDGHMNAHYSSYICYECGDTFLAASRLNKHVEVHNSGQYPCKACNKVFKLKKYMKKHYDLVHSHEQKIKCLYCPEKFFGAFQRHQHVMEMHKERVKISACEICGKTFDWQPYYTAHMRRIHGAEKNYKCKECGKTFLMKYELKNHQVKHETERNYICDVCSERFKSKPGLMRHSRVHHGQPKSVIKVKNMMPITLCISVWSKPGSQMHEILSCDKTYEGTPKISCRPRTPRPEPSSSNLAMPVNNHSLEAVDVIKTENDVDVKEEDKDLTVSMDCDSDYIPDNFDDVYASDVTKDDPAAFDEGTGLTEAALIARFPRDQLKLPTRESLQASCPEFFRHLELLKGKIVLPRMIAKLLNHDDTDQTLAKRKKLYISEKMGHIVNASLLLEHSNATPFKNRNRSGFPCFYCRKVFENLEKLQEHQGKLHKKSEIKKILATYGAECFVVYVDVTNLTCTICDERVPNINELRSHLTKAHKKRFHTEFTDRVVPFKLSQTNIYECQVCGFNFETFGSIERHMNVHYRNYVCEECGTGFVTKYRLRVHAKSLHSGGTFPCDICKKVYSTLQKQKNHVAAVHMNVKRFKCPKCSERFSEYFRRQKHLVDVHGVAPLRYKCNVCDKSFDRRYTLSRHLKRDHLEERDFQCNVCSYTCFTKNELRVHMVKHNGERIYECSVCKKSYARKKTLKEHMRIHNNDRRFACAVCGQAFVQKCSLKGHIKTHHIEYSLQ
ncbi:zinc finger protein 11-like [Battus philenor]|uniref:zinc finger protein 11-like n=1 Tax=Battus philenor TaxID=42288 RepID=UPI0035D1022C